MRRCSLCIQTGSASANHLVLLVLFVGGDSVGSSSAATVCEVGSVVSVAESGLFVAAFFASALAVDFDGEAYPSVGTASDL